MLKLRRQLKRLCLKTTGGAISRKPGAKGDNLSWLSGKTLSGGKPLLSTECEVEALQALLAAMVSNELAETSRELLDGSYLNRSSAEDPKSVHQLLRLCSEQAEGIKVARDPDEAGSFLS
jgi:hypothetical protein